MWTHIVHAWWWLQANNFWKAQVAFWVTLVLGAVVTACLRPWRTWKHHRALQEKIADRLDTSTPGGLADLVQALQELTSDNIDGESPDDNGSDSLLHSGGKSVIPTPHGGSSASHR